MAGVDYDPFGGWLRMAKAAEHLDMEAAQILTFHAALEVEMDEVLGKLLPRAELLKGVGFPNKVRVLQAAWIGAPEVGDRFCRVLSRFNDLRNAVAHGDQKQIAGCKGSLRESYAGIDPDAPEQLEIGEIAQGICAFMGDGPMPREFVQMSKSLSGLVNRLGSIMSVTNPRGTPASGSAPD